jgi:hypothetical protein
VSTAGIASKSGAAAGTEYAVIDDDQHQSGGNGIINVVSTPDVTQAAVVA